MPDDTRSPRGGTDPPAEPPLPPLDAIQPEHGAYVRAVLARLGVMPTHHREDLVQEVLVRAHRARASPLDVRALLYSIARRAVGRWKRKKRRREEVEPAAAAWHGEDAPSPRDEQEAAERRAAVEAALAELEPIERDALVRIDLEGATAPEVADEVGVPVNTIYSRLHRARRRFLAALFRYLARRRMRPEDL